LFDIGWQEMFIVLVLGIVVVGPQELPRVVRMVLGLVRKARGLARDFQDGLDEIVKEAELGDIKEQMSSVSSMDIEKAIEEAVDPTGEISRDLDMGEIEKELTGKSSKEEDDKGDKDSSENEGADGGYVGPGRKSRRGRPKRAR
jgi:sec-independent protein translocase protein TatB